ncbi:hypothetical protein MIDIC_490023 [Alphaproteobacteria bacterium]
MAIKCCFDPKRIAVYYISAQEPLAMKTQTKGKKLMGQVFRIHQNSEGSRF